MAIASSKLNKVSKEFPQKKMYIFFKHNPSVTYTLFRDVYVMAQLFRSLLVIEECLVVFEGVALMTVTCTLIFLMEVSRMLILQISPLAHL